MTAPSNANTSGLEVVAWVSAEQLEAHTDRPETPTGGRYLPVRKTAAGHFTQGLVTAASAQARIAELEAETDVLKVEVIGLRAAIFGSHDYDPTLRHGNFIEMARATEDGRQGAVARATAAEARADRLGAALIEALPFVESCEYDNGYKPGAVIRVVKNIRAALQQEG